MEGRYGQDLRVIEELLENAWKKIRELDHRLTIVEAVPDTQAEWDAINEDSVR